MNSAGIDKTKFYSYGGEGKIVPRFCAGGKTSHQEPKGS